MPDIELAYPLPDALNRIVKEDDAKALWRAVTLPEAPLNNNFFIGKSIQAIDDKSRLYLPAKWQKHFEYQRALLLAGLVDEYTGLKFVRVAPAPLIWEASAGGEIVKAALAKDRLRMPLADALRCHAGVESEAQLCGCIDYFEIWEPGRFERWQDFARTGKLLK